MYDEGQHQLQVEDVLTQPVLPSFTQWLASLFGRFKKDDRDSRLVFHRLQPNSSIVLRLDQAFYLPNRNGSEGTFSGLRLCSSNPSAPDLFARISFLNVSVVTPVAVESEEPIKKSVELRIIKDGEPVPFWGDVQDKCIRIDLFDKYSQTENHFLATAQIPLRSVFLNGKIEGSLVMKSAPFYMSHQPMEQLPRLSLSVSMKPQLAVDSYPMPSPVGEIDILNDRAHQLWNSFREKYGKRRHVFLVMTSLLESYLPCRLIKKQTLEGLEGNLPLLAFVSLIPSLPDTDIPDKPGYIIGTSQNILDNQLGSYIEHAVLLCNILLGRGENVYVVLGSEISTGYCAYVLRRTPVGPPPQSKKEKQKYNHLLIDPISGNIFEVTDPHCAIHDIGTIFNDKNMWYNVQASGRPDEIDWDFENEKSKNWVRFWTEKGELPEGINFQPDHLTVEDYIEEHKSDIQELVEKLTEESVEELRKPQDTIWHKGLEQELVCLLKQRKKLSSPERHDRNEFEGLLNKVRRHHKSFRIEGSPFFIGYVYDENNLDDLQEHINEEIKKRELYIGIEGAQLARAVVITPYPNDIFAIWILVVVANPKQKSGKKGAEEISSSFSMEMEEDEKPKSAKKSAKQEKAQSSKKEVSKREASPKKEKSSKRGKSPPASAKRRSRHTGKSATASPRHGDKKSSSKQMPDLLVFSSSSSDDEARRSKKPAKSPSSKTHGTRTKKAEQEQVDTRQEEPVPEPEKVPQTKAVESEPKLEQPETKQIKREEPTKPEEQTKTEEPTKREAKQESDHGKKSSSSSDSEPKLENSPQSGKVLMLGEDTMTENSAKPSPAKKSKPVDEKSEKSEELKPTPPPSPSTRSKDDRKFRPVPPTKLVTPSKDDSSKDEDKDKPRSVKTSSPHEGANSSSGNKAEAKKETSSSGGTEKQKSSSPDKGDKKEASSSGKEGDAKSDEIRQVKIQLKVESSSGHSEKREPAKSEEKHIKIEMKMGSSSNKEEPNDEPPRKRPQIIVNVHSSSDHEEEGNQLPDHKSDSGGDIPLSPDSDAKPPAPKAAAKPQKQGSDSSVNPDESSSSSARIPVVVTPPMSDSENEDAAPPGGFKPHPPAVNKPRLARRPTASNSEAQESDVVPKAKPQKKKVPANVRDLQSRRRTRRLSSPDKERGEGDDDDDASSDEAPAKTIEMDRMQLQSRRRGRRQQSDSDS